MIKTQLKYLGLGSILLCMIYLGVSMTINFEEIYLKFHTQLAEAGYDSKAASIEISHFPFPKVTLREVSIPGVLEAQNVYVSFSILSILTFNPIIDQVQIFNIKGNYPTVNILYHEEAVSKILKILPQIPDVDMNNITFHNATGESIENVKYVQLRPSSRSNNIKINWDNKSYTNITYSKKDNIEVKISTIAPTYTLNVLEQYSSDFTIKKGNITYEIKNLKEYVDSNYRDFDLLITQIASNEPASLSADFISQQDGISIENIHLVSESIEMKGGAEIYKSDRKDSINLHFNKLNLTQLLKAPDMQSVILSKEKNELKLQDMNSIITLTADEVLLHSFILNNIKIITESDRSKLDINECTGDIKDEGKFALSGSVTQNPYRSKFNGKVNFTYAHINHLLESFGYNNLVSSIASSLSITSDIEATPIDYKLTNLSATIGQVTSRGSAAIKLIGMVPRVNLSLVFSSLDLSQKEYAILTPLRDYFKSLVENMADPEYSNKYIALRKIGYLGNFDITLVNPIIENEPIDKIHFICDVSSGILDFTSLYYQKGRDYLLGSFKLLSTALKPTLRFYVADGELSVNFLSFDNIINTLNNANKNLDIEKVNLDVAVALKTLAQEDKTIKNFYGAFTNDRKLLNISSLQGYYNTGGFVSLGNLLLDSMTLNLSYAYSNFNINDLNVFYPVAVFGIKDGWVSSNGTISTTGDNITKWLYNLYTKSDFVASTIGWTGFDVDGFVKAIDKPDYNITNLNSDASTFLSTGDTNFQKIAGKYEITRGNIKFSDIKFATNRVSGSAIAQYNIYKSETDSTLKTIFAPMARNAYNTPDSVEFTMHTYGNISAVKKDFDLANVKHMIDRNKTNIGVPFNKKIHN